MSATDIELWELVPVFTTEVKMTRVNAVSVSWRSSCSHVRRFDSTTAGFGI